MQVLLKTFSVRLIIITLLRVRYNMDSFSNNSSFDYCKVFIHSPISPRFLTDISYPFPDPVYQLHTPLLDQGMGDSYLFYVNNFTVGLSKRAFP